MKTCVICSECLASLGEGP